PKIGPDPRRSRRRRFILEPLAPQGIGRPVCANNPCREVLLAAGGGRTGLATPPQAQTRDSPEGRRRFGLFHHHHRIDGERFVDNARCRPPQRITDSPGESRWYWVRQRHVEAVLIKHVRIPPRVQQLTLSARQLRRRPLGLI